MIQVKHFLVVFITLLWAAGTLQAQILLGQQSFGSGVTPVAPATQNFDFSYSNLTSGIIAVGNLQTINSGLGDGSLLATSGDLTVLSGPFAGSYPLQPGGPGMQFTPDYTFTYDDLIYPNNNSPYSTFLTGNGLLFTGLGAELNIFSPGVGGYSFYGSVDGVKQNLSTCPGTLSLTPSGTTNTPEPASIIVLCAGLAAVSVYVRRRAAPAQ